MKDLYPRFTDRSVDSVNHYISVINRRKFDPLSNQDEHDLGIRAMQGDKEARERLINANLRYVVSVAKRYQSSKAAFEDLIQAGNAGLVIAVDKFDASRGNRLITFATWYIENEISKAAYAHIRHKNRTSSFDEPIDADNSNSATKLNYLPASSDVAPDWHIRYDDTLNALKQRLDKQYYPGAGLMLDDYLTMAEQGFTPSDFALKYNLSANQLKRFLDMVRTESRHYLTPAA